MAPYTLARAHSTITAWEGDLVGEAHREFGVPYADTTYDEHVVVAGSMTDATYFMTITAAVGNRHDGTLGCGQSP